MIIVPKLFNLYSRLDRPTWQQWKDRRLRLLKFVRHPAFWGLPEDQELVRLAGGPMLTSANILLHGTTVNTRAAGSTLALTTLNASDLDTGLVVVGIRFLRAGDVQEQTNGSWSTQNTATEWILAAEETSTIGDDHQCKMDESLTSNIAWSSGWADNTYIAISATRTATLASGSGEVNANGTAYVRETANTSNEVSASFFMTAESIGGMGGILL